MRVIASLLILAAAVTPAFAQPASVDIAAARVMDHIDPPESSI